MENTLKSIELYAKLFGAQLAAVTNGIFQIRVLPVNLTFNFFSHRLFRV